MSDFQNRVFAWLQAAFPVTLWDNPTERSQRFCEESLELVQARGMTKAQVLAIVDYVYARPVGKDIQEVGGVRVTLAALCSQAGINDQVAGEHELHRCWVNIDKIRAKQNVKPATISQKP